MSLIGSALAVSCAAVSACAWFLLQTRRTLAARNVALHCLEQAQADAGAKLARLAPDLEARRQEALALKQEVGAQRKKNHTLQQGLKAAQAELKAERMRRLEAQNTRPAFADTPVRLPEPTPEPERRAAPEPERKPAPARVASDAEMQARKREVELLTRLRAAESQAAQLQTLCTGEQAQLQELKIELHKLRRKAEDYRRIDIISRSRTELLEDKLRSLARLHYEAISELSALRGEVTPPRPREMAEPAARTSEFNADAADSPHTPVTLFQ